MEKYILSVLVKNNAGVLARVSSLFGRRGFNIDSLTVSTTNNQEISRITIITRGDEKTLDQIIKQVSKLEETLWIEHLWEDECYCRELVFVKVLAEDALARDSIREVAEVYNANVVESVKNAIIVELTEVPSRVDAFLAVISNYTIIEMCRSGVTAMTR